MDVVAIIASLIAVAISLVSLRFAFRADRREERRAQLDDEEAASRRRGRPIAVPRGGSGGSGAPRIQHNYEVRNAGEATITKLELWIEDGGGNTRSTVAGGGVVLGPGEVATMAVEVSQPLPDEQTLMVRWVDSDDEHTESTGVHPPPHM